MNVSCQLPMRRLGAAAPRAQTPVARLPRGAASRSGPIKPLCRLSRRQEGSWVVQAGGGGGNDGGSSGGSGGSGGGGGGDGGEGQPEDKKEPMFRWKGWEDRVAADPQFAYKVFIEQVIGVGASVAGDMAGRPNWGLNELDFVFATLVVGSIVNFALMWLLAPTASAAGGGAASINFFQRLFTEHNLVAMGAPGGHMFQPGYSLGARLINFAYKGCVFAFIGMCSGLIGTALSNSLVALRKKMDPTYTSPNAPPNVLANASCWALHMGISSNLRYQMLNGLDMVLQPRMPSGLFRLFTSVVRGVNNAIGGISFVVIAKVFGVQKAAEPAAEPAPAPAAGKKKSK